jgi:hypothetical protein
MKDERFFVIMILVNDSVFKITIISKKGVNAMTGKINGR